MHKISISDGYYIIHIILNYIKNDFIIQGNAPVHRYLPGRPCCPVDMMRKSIYDVDATLF